MLKKRLLLVEDNEPNARLIALMCEVGGHEVVRAHDGQAALDILASEHVDIVLLDVCMPVMDGPQVLRRIREQPRHRLLPVVFLTALALQEDHDRLLLLGASAVLGKPFARKALLACLAHVLAREARALG